MVLLGSAVGLLVVAALAMASHQNRAWLARVSFFGIYGCPFLIALVGTWWRRDVRQARWVWALAALGGIAVGLAMLFNGAGIFLLGVAALYAWVFIATRPRHGHQDGDRLR